MAEEKIFHDRFHVIKLVNEAVDKVRKEENRRLRDDGDNLLVGAKYLLLKNYENVSDQRQDQLHELLKAKLETGKAWTYKEILRDLLHWDTAAEATELFKWWYKSVIHTKLEPLKKVAKTIKERLQNVVSHRSLGGISSGVSKGINNRV